MITPTYHTNDADNSKDEDMNEIRPDDYEWLGLVHPEDVRQEVALITPLAFYADNQWRPVSYHTTQHYFPNNGKVAIFARDFPVSKTGRLCFFWPEQNTHIKDAKVPNYSHYLVKNELKLASFAQILDWTSRATDPLELPTILEMGIGSARCFTQRIYIRHHHYLYGPIKLDQVGERLMPHEYVQSNNNGGPTLLVSVYDILKNDILTLNDEKYQLDIFYENLLEPPIKQEDWSLPQVVIKRVLQASKSATTLVDDVQLVDNHIRRLARLSSQDGPSALRLEEVTLQRAQHIVEHQVERLHDMQKLIEDLPTEHPLLKVAYERVAQLKKTEIDRETNESVQGEKLRFQQLQVKIQDAQDKLDTLNEASEVAETRLKTLQDAVKRSDVQFSTLHETVSKAKDDAATAEKRRDQALAVEHEVQQRLMRLREEPLRVLADLQIAASLFPLLGQPEQSRQNTHETIQSSHIPMPHRNIQPSQQQMPRQDNAIWTADIVAGKAPADLHALQKKFWLQFAQSNGVQSENALVCFAALLAGCIPELSSFASISLVQTVAQAIANMRVWSISVPLTALTPLDLFGRIEPDTRQFIPAAGSLADIIVQAQKHPQELALVLLEGIDRAPAMPVVVPLLRQYIQVRQNRIQPAPLNLFHPLAVAPDDPYQELAWFTWPGNILLAVTRDDDIGSLPLPEICDSWLPYIEAKPRSNTAARLETSISPLHVPFNTWQNWTARIQQEALQRKDAGSVLEQQMLYETLSVLGIKNPDEVMRKMWPGEDSDEEAEAL